MVCVCRCEATCCLICYALTRFLWSFLDITGEFFGHYIGVVFWTFSRQCLKTCLRFFWGEVRPFIVQKVWTLLGPSFDQHVFWTLASGKQLVFWTLESVKKLPKTLPTKAVSNSSIAWGGGFLTLLLQTVFWTLANVQKTRFLTVFGHWMSKKIAQIWQTLSNVRNDCIQICSNVALNYVQIHHSQRPNWLPLTVKQLSNWRPLTVK